MSNYKNMSAAFARAVIVCLALGWMTLPAHAQEIPDFGSGAASSIIEDTPVRARPGEPPAPPPPTEEGEQPFDEIVTTGRRVEEFTREWSAVPGIVHSDSAGVIGFDLKGKKKREGNKSDQYLISYNHVDPDGTDGPFHQGKLRYRNTFASFASGWAFEGQAQLTKRWEKYFEQSAHLNITFRPYERLAMNVGAGYVRRDRDSAAVLEDRDLRFSVRQAIPQTTLAFSFEYRLENDISKEDDFTFGAEYGSWSMTLGKHGVASLSYTASLQSAP